MRPPRFFFRFGRHVGIVVMYRWLSLLRQRIFRSPDVALAECSGLDGQGIVDNIAIHVGA